jgi:hypothetical protein
MSIRLLYGRCTVLRYKAENTKSQGAEVYLVPGLLVVAAFVLIAVVGLTLVQRIVPSQLRASNTTTWRASSTPSWTSSTPY